VREVTLAAAVVADAEAGDVAGLDPERQLPALRRVSLRRKVHRKAPLCSRRRGSACNTGINERSASAPPHLPKGSVILAIGLPGSGKSSWFKRHNVTPLSSDMLRGLLFDDPTEQRFQDLIFSNLRSMLKARLIARRPLNYVDATNLTAPRTPKLGQTGT